MTAWRYKRVEWIKTSYATLKELEGKITTIIALFTSGTLKLPGIRIICGDETGSLMMKYHSDENKMETE